MQCRPATALRAHPALLPTYSHSTGRIILAKILWQTRWCSPHLAEETQRARYASPTPTPRRITQLVRTDWELETRPCDCPRPCLLPCARLSCVWGSCPAPGLKLTTIVTITDSCWVVSSFWLCSSDSLVSSRPSGLLQMYLAPAKGKWPFWWDFCQLHT